MVWNAETAFAGDWAFIDGVKDATFTPKDAERAGSTTYAVKVLWDDDDTDQMPSGSRPALPSAESALCRWVAGSGAPDPAHGAQITVTSEDFTILSSRWTRRSVFVLQVQTELANT